jgi:asparagine synthase (glutamine-hydrolysing)
MSAIMGIYYRDGRPVAPADLQRMVDVLAHRGPDGSGTWHHGAVGLAHRMLWTTPESLQERLPLTGAAGTLVLTADARLDNREDLIATLGLGSSPPTEIADGALILRAYERWGEECPTHFLGDFAFAIWDGRHRKLVLGRDPIGVKCLYYYCSGQTLVFATEIKALFCLADAPRQLNELRIAEYLVSNFEDRAATFYRDVFRLPAAHLMVVGETELRLQRYWAPDPSRRVRRRSDQEYAEQFREIFSEAVRCRLRSAFEVSSTLSGGLDSSSIACTAGPILRARGSPPLHTLSAIFPSLSERELRMIDERQYIEAVLASGVFKAHYVHADQLNPLMDLGTILGHTDEAFVAPNLYLHWALYAAAQQQHCRVFLDGIDGDTTVSHGLGYFAELAGSGRWRRLMREAVALAVTSGSYTCRRTVWEFGIRPLIPESAFRVRNLFRHQQQVGWGGEAAIRSEFARRIGLMERLRSQSLPERTPARTEREVHRRGLASALIPYTLELADKSAAAFSLEARYPFFDRRLMEFCLALPPEQKLHAGWTRVIMRRAMAGILPQEVQWRRHKANLSPNFIRRFLDCNAETLERIVHREPYAIEPYVDVSVLRAAYDRCVSAASPAVADVVTVYRAVMLALWLEKTGLRSQ